MTETAELKEINKKIKVHVENTRSNVAAIMLVILNVVLVLWSANWTFTPLCLAPLTGLIFVFKRMKATKWSRGITAVIPSVLSFISALAAAGGALTPLTFLTLTEFIMVIDKIGAPTTTT